MKQKLKACPAARTRITRFRDGSEVIESRGGYTLVEARPPYRVAHPVSRRKRRPAGRLKRRQA